MGIPAIPAAPLTASRLIGASLRQYAQQYISCLPGRYSAQDSTAVDASGAGGDANVRVSLGPAAAFANAGYMTTAAAASAGLYIDRDRAKFDLSQDSLLIAFGINAANTGTIQDMLGNGSQTSAHGVYFSMRTNGKIRPFVFGSGGLISTFPDSQATVFDSTDHFVVFAVDGKTKDAYLFIDGVLDSYVYNWLSGSTAPTTTFNFGKGGGDLGSMTTYAAKFFGFHMLKFANSGLPINLGEVALKLYEFPRLPLGQYDVALRDKAIALAVVGQSNEAGAGNYGGGTYLRGRPRRDAVGAARSLWPYLQHLAGKRAVSLQVSNTAIGATSLAASWCGQCLAWVSGMTVTRGSYVLSSGALWRCAVGAGAVPQSTVAPTGLGDFTGADGVPWVYLGAPSAADTAGHVYADGEARFDPNGYIAAAHMGIAGLSGFDAKWVYIQIGQGDKTLSTPSSRFAQAYINVANYFLARGIKACLGFTCRAATAGADAWYDAQLVPGWQAALAHFAANPNVAAGPSLYAALGALPVSPVYGPGLLSDSVHMNNLAYDAASEVLDAKFSTNGMY